MTFDPHLSEGSSRNHRLMHRATLAAVATASVLIVVKFVAWISTGSLALLASFVDSCLDAAASLVNMMAVRQAVQPADADHRFGHGKAESVAGLAQAAFIAGSAVFLMLESAERFVSPIDVSHEAVGIGVMVFSIVLTALLVMFQRYVVRQTHSLAIEADSTHYVGDILVNASVIVAFGCHWIWDWNWVDSAFAIFIAAYLGKNAWEIGRTALDQLMDREMPDADRKKIIRLALAQDGAVAMHDLRTRVSGPTAFIQLHLEVDGNTPLSVAHTVADKAENAISAEFSGAEVIVHLDPVGLDETVKNPLQKERVVASELQDAERST